MLTQCGLISCYSNRVLYAYKVIILIGLTVQISKNRIINIETCNNELIQSLIWVFLMCALFLSALRYWKLVIASTNFLLCHESNDYLLDQMVFGRPQLYNSWRTLDKPLYPWGRFLKVRMTLFQV